MPQGMNVKRYRAIEKSCEMSLCPYCSSCPRYEDYMVVVIPIYDE